MHGQKNIKLRNKRLLIMQPTCMWQGLCVHTVKLAALQEYKNSYAFIFIFV